MSCELGRILQFKEAMVYQQVILKDAVGNDITNTCQFAWSADGVCWTKWYDYNSYLQNIVNIETDYYLRILFYSSLGDVIVGHSLTKCYYITLYDPGEFIQNFCDNPNLFQPYNNLDCALLMQQQMADSVICMFGIPIYYFKVNPDGETVDYTFKEYSLHNVSEVKQLKLMIADGQMPSSNYKLTDFDFDWESDWETEISKTQFAQAFGDTTIPCDHDFIYIPMMKRMWRVNAAYDEKNEGLMWRSTTWKLSLLKYTELTNVDNNKFEDLIDSFIVNKYDDVIGKIERTEQSRQVGADPVELPKAANTSLFDVRKTDAVRQECSKDNFKIEDLLICQNNNIIGRNMYNLQDGGYIGYQKGACGDSGTLSFILYNIYNYSSWRDVIQLGNINIKIKTTNVKSDTNTLLFNNMKCELLKNEMYLVICRWNKQTMSSDISIYIRKSKSNNPYAQLRPESFSFDLENPVIELAGGYNEDFEMTCQHCAALFGPVSLTNIKYYNKSLDIPEALKESFKYVTKHDNCVINDLARPFTLGYGYSVR